MDRLVRPNSVWRALIPSGLALFWLCTTEGYEYIVVLVSTRLAEGDLLPELRNYGTSWCPPAASLL